MSDGDLETLMHRIENLEGARRRFRRIVLSCLLLAPLLVAARPDRGEIEAGAFVLRDLSGGVRGTWRPAEDGGTELALRDPEGTTRLVLSVAGDGRPAIDLRDAGGMLRVRLLLTRESSLNFYDSAARLRAGLGVTSYGPTPVRPFGQNQRFSADDFFAGGWRAPAEPEGALRNEDDGPVFKLYDAGGKPRLEARVDGEEPFLFLHTPQGTIRHVQTEGEPPSAP